ERFLRAVSGRRADEGSGSLGRSRARHRARLAAAGSMERVSPPESLGGPAIWVRIVLRAIPGREHHPRRLRVEWTGARVPRERSTLLRAIRPRRAVLRIPLLSADIVPAVVADSADG